MGIARHEFHKATRTFTGADVETWAVLAETGTGNLRVEHRYERTRYGTTVAAATVYEIEEFLTTADGKWLRAELNATLSKIRGGTSANPKTPSPLEAFDTRSRLELRVLESNARKLRN